MEPRLEAIDAALLQEPVRAALRNNLAEIVNWNWSAITRGVAGGTGESAVYRFQGRALVAGRLVPWRTILKMIRHAGGDKPSDGDWKREVDAYRSGLFDKLPEGLAAPRCFGIEEFPNGSCWLWLEDVADEIANWPLERYGLAARHLGRFAGSFLGPETVPTWPWLSTRFIRQDLAGAVAEHERLRDSMNQPLMRQFFPGDAGTRALRILAEREDFLAAMDSLPQTLCHFDAFRRNLMARGRQGRGETVLIDWGFVGQGPIGAELASLVWVSLAMIEVDSADAAALDQIVFTGFLSGLRDAGWRGDERLVRLGYTAATALRRLGTYGHALSAILDEKMHASFERVAGVSITQCADHWARAGNYVETLADEARRLATAGQ
jgi:hypothetical protein